MCTKKFQVKSTGSGIEITKYLTLLPYDQIHHAAKYMENLVLDREQALDLFEIYANNGGMDVWGDTWELVNE